MNDREGAGENDTAIPKNGSRSKHNGQNFVNVAKNECGVILAIADGER